MTGCGGPDDRHLVQPGASQTLLEPSLERWVRIIQEAEKKKKPKEILRSMNQSVWLVNHMRVWLTWECCEL